MSDDLYVAVGALMLTIYVLFEIINFRKEQKDARDWQRNHPRTGFGYPHMPPPPPPRKP